MEDVTPDAVLDFWFAGGADDVTRYAARSDVWFRSDPVFDEDVRSRLAATLAQAGRGELRRWKLTPRGTLALILLFDQVPRNIFRATPQAFAYDARAQALARDGVASGIDDELTVGERTFFYLPFEHAEDMDAQTRSMACHARLHEEAPPAWREITASTLRWARIHHDIVARFGRFPHRNLVLDRAPRGDEVAWLAENGNHFGQG